MVLPGMAHKISSLVQQRRENGAAAAGNGVGTRDTDLRGCSRGIHVTTKVSARPLLSGQQRRERRGEQDRLRKARSLEAMSPDGHPPRGEEGQPTDEKHLRPSLRCCSGYGCSRCTIQHKPSSGWQSLAGMRESVKLLRESPSCPSSNGDRQDVRLRFDLSCCAVRPRNASLTDNPSGVDEDGTVERPMGAA